MMNKFNIENLRLDVLKKNHFIEYLQFKVKKDRRFGYNDFSRATGISRMQWDVFRSDNRKVKKINWVLE